MKKYEFILKDLDCANCAREVEEALAEKEGMQNVVVNFSTLKLSYETDMVSKEQVIKWVNEVEPDVEVIEAGQNNKSEKSSANNEVNIGADDGATSKISNNTKQDTNNNINKSANKRKFQVERLILGILIAGAGLVLEKKNLLGNFSTILIILAYAILLYRTAKNAIKLLIKSHSINENLLITISCIGAYFVGEHFEGLMVIILYEIGKILEDKAINKSRKSIADLMNIKPEYANLKLEKETKKVSPEDVKIGDIIVVKEGEKVALDGKIVSGKASLNTASLTGESKLRKVAVGDQVLSGSINADGLLELKVTEEYKNSTVSRILDLVENATDKKAKTETFVNKAAKIYTPIVIVLAIIVAIGLPFVSKVTYSESIYRALIFLVISCPCSIAISVPLSYFSGIGKASKNGILIKGSNFIDTLKDVKDIAFDKTGTLTKGEFGVSKVELLDKNYTENELLKIVVAGENLSNHPIAKSIVKTSKTVVDSSDVKDYKEIAGKGISFEFEGKKVLVGNLSLANDLANDLSNENAETVRAKENKTNENSKKVDNKKENTDLKDDSTVIYVIINEKLTAKIYLADEVKLGAKASIQNLNMLGINTKMCTGDNSEVAKNVALELGIKEVKSEMLPEDKYREIEKMVADNKDTSKKVAFVGDGINDSPVLAIADVGISMGGVGSSSAIEASDVVIMTDDLDKIVDAIKISKKTCDIIKQNLIFAVAVKIIILTLSTIGIGGMWQAIFADVGVTLITIFNTLRILK